MPVHLQNRLLILSCLFAALVSLPCRLAANVAEAGEHFLEHYGPAEYNASPQNHSIVQDSRGLIYVANNSGVLQYDGSAWRLIPVHGSSVLALALDSNDRVWVGADGDLGYIAPDRTDALRFTSIAGQLSPGDRNVGLVRSIHVTPTGVWFRANAGLIRFDSSSKKLAYASHKPFNRAMLVGGEYFVSTTEGLFRDTPSGLQSVPGSSPLVHEKIQGMCLFGGMRLVITRQTIYRQQGSEYLRWPTEADAYLAKNEPATALALRSGLLAIGTFRGGLVLLDSTGKLRRIVTDDAGLPSRAITQLFEDRARDLWMSLDRGIAKIEVESPISTFGPREGLQETVYAIARSQGKIYAGTALGLTALETGAPGLPPHFEAVDGVSRSIIVLRPTPWGILAGGESGLFYVNNGSVTQLLEGPNAIYDIAPSHRNPNLFFASGHGLFSFERQGELWVKRTLLSESVEDHRAVIEDQDGSIWTTAKDRLLHLTSPTGEAAPRSYGSKEGFPPGWTNLFWHRNQVLFATPIGLRRLDPGADRLVPFNEFVPPGRAASAIVELVQQDARGRIWIGGEDRSGYWENGVWTNLPLVRAGIRHIYAWWSDADGVVWASGPDGGLVRLDTPPSLHTAPLPIPLVRSIESLNEKRTIYSGDNAATKLGATLPHQQNSLRFTFSWPVFRNESHIEYQVRLDDLDKDWSAWSKELYKDYTNLPGRKYSLHVRARTPGGETSESAAFSFQVLAPWFLTWWAYLLYTASLVGSVYLLIRWRIAQLEAQNRRLETIVEERTVEVRRQRDEIRVQEQKTEKLLLNILPQTVANELRHTGRVEPQGYDRVAVCFTDFVGFTLASERMSAPELVDTLHTYFSAFDEIIQRYRLERLKTIGDAYMFVGGLPQPSSSFALDTVLAALEILKTCEEWATASNDIGWRIRLGVHCGPATAGVVGTHKFAFDIWGGTVNLASRIESSGSANRVNLSESAYELVRDFIECEPRGLVKTKEGRLLTMFFAQHVHPHLLDNGGQRFEELYQRRFGKPAPRIRLRQPEKAVGQFA